MTLADDLAALIAAREAAWAQPLGTGARVTALLAANTEADR